MKSAQIRNTFIEYFKKNGHTFVPSSPTTAKDDPTLLFTNAGMNQFKNTFLGLETREYKRATNSQKCVRAGGKHNDLEAVGHTARHHTFFEMLGNFSFSDYFKEEAISYAWELLTQEIGFDPQRLYVTVFETDDDAADIWHKKIGISKDRIFRFGEKDNFWRMGEVGPCGPSSEIFFDHGELPGEISDPYKNIAAGGDRFVEIWNLVFMQYNESAPGKMSPLERPSIDTGAGLERWAAALQGRPNNYDTDLFLPIMRAGANAAGVEFSDNPSDRPQTADYQESLTSLRVLSDHARTTAFLIADGVLPSNEGAGYVLRRIMRRAIRYARKLSGASVFPMVVASVIDEMSDFFGELNQRRDIILSTVRDEETRFLTTLDTGTELLADSLKSLESKGQKTLSGKTVFKLYDTFGFPADLTQIMAEERGFRIDSEGFESEMAEARKKARASWKGNSNDLQRHLTELVKDIESTQFTGYEKLTDHGQVLALSDGSNKQSTLAAGAPGFLIAHQTPFYAEGGGQIGDRGEIWNGSTRLATVEDCQKIGEVFIHSISAESDLSVDSEVELRVMSRGEVANHHSATHLLHAALRKILGEHVTQAGSLVEADRLRFDFTHGKPVSPEQLEQIESQVNGDIERAYPVSAEVMDQQAAFSKGALALFGEKYGDTVRVVQMGSASIELCGGTHVTNTAQLRAFLIASETGVSAGVRRIEALAGRAALQYLRKHAQEHQRALAAAGSQQNWLQFLDDSSKEKLDLAEWIEQKKTTIRKMQKELQSMESSKVDFDGVIREARPFSADGVEGRLARIQLPTEDRKVLSEVADKLRDKIQSGVVVVLGKGEKQNPLLVAVTKNITPKVHAGKLLKSATEVLGGKGGGRPDFAQGAAESSDKWDDAIDTIAACLGNS